MTCKCTMMFEKIKFMYFDDVYEYSTINFAEILIMRR